MFIIKMIIDTYISLTKGNYDKEYVSDMISSLLSCTIVIWIYWDIVGYSGAFLVTEIKNREIEEKDVIICCHIWFCRSVILLPYFIV